jgi:hypothetical protein
MTQCPACNQGTIWIEEPYYNDETGETEIRLVPYKCSECDGEGTLNERDRRALVREMAADADYEESKLNES